MSTHDDLAERLIRDHERSLVVGARVRVSIGECRQHGYPDFPESMYRLTNRRTGVILSRTDAYPADPFYGTHPYMVRYDDGGRFWSGAFAAAELIVIEDQESPT